MGGNNGWFKVRHEASEILTREKYIAYVDLAKRANLSGGKVSVTHSEIAREYEWSRWKAREFLIEIADFGILENAPKRQVTNTQNDRQNDTLEPMNTGADEDEPTPKTTGKTTGNQHPDLVPIHAHAGARTDLLLKIKSKDKDPLYPPGDNQIPDWIKPELWLQWIQFRKEKKQPLKATTITFQIRQLTKWHTEGLDVNEILIQSITMGYTGLFIPKDSNGGKPNSRSIRDGFAKAAAEARRDEGEADSDGSAGATESDIPF
jgi:hypothetical protein